MVSYVADAILLMRQAGSWPDPQGLPGGGAPATHVSVSTACCEQVWLIRLFAVRTGRW